MKSLQEVEKHYYRDVGTFIDLVCQRDMSCTKIILVSTKADGELSSWLPSWIPVWLTSWLPDWLTLPLQPCPDVLASIIQKAKNHLSYLSYPDVQPEVFLFDKILVTSSKLASRDQLHLLHTVIEAMVKKVRPLSKKAIPQSWFAWLQKLRENPSVLKTDLPDLIDRQGPVNLTVEEIKQLERLKDLLDLLETTPTTHDLLKQERPTVEKTFIIESRDTIDGSKSEIMCPKAQNISQGKFPLEEGKKEEVDQVTQIPQELPAHIRFFREMTEILWYSTLPQLTHLRNSTELRNQIITDPMYLIKALRSILKHNVKDSFDKRKPVSTLHYEDLTQKGKIPFDVFEKIYISKTTAENLQFTAAEVWGFLFQLDIACPLDDKRSLAFIPSLINNEMQEEFRKHLDETKISGSSLCIQYTFERPSVGIFNKLLSSFAKAHKIGTTGGEIELAFVEKVEEREMEITAGVSGSVTTYSSQEEEQQLYFLLHEFETRVDPLHKKGGISHHAHPVHKGIRIYLQQKERNAVTETVLQFMGQIHKDFASVLTDVYVRLVCPTCLEEETTIDEGYLEVGDELDLRSVKCSTSKHDLPEYFKEIFIPGDKSIPQGNYQCTVFMIRYLQLTFYIY